MWRSVRHTPQARTLTSTSPGSATGTSRSPGSTEPAPARTRAIARIDRPADYIGWEPRPFPSRSDRKSDRGSDLRSDRESDRGDGSALAAEDGLRAAGASDIGNH